MITRKTAGMLARYGSTPAAIIGFMLVAPFLGPGGLLEELGWRGGSSAAPGARPGGWWWPRPRRCRPR